MTFNTVHFTQTDLASRVTAANKRVEILALLKESDDARVLIDFSNVKSLSGSYADELFGVIALEKGQEFIKQRLIVGHATSSVKRAIVVAIRERLALYSGERLTPSTV